MFLGQEAALAPQGRKTRCGSDGRARYVSRVRETCVGFGMASTIDKWGEFRASPSIRVVRTELESLRQLEELQFALRPGDPDWSDYNSRCDPATASGEMVCVFVCVCVCASGWSRSGDLPVSSYARGSGI